MCPLKYRYTFCKHIWRENIISKNVIWVANQMGSDVPILLDKSVKTDIKKKINCGEIEQHFLIALLTFYLVVLFPLLNYTTAHWTISDNSMQILATVQWRWCFNILTGISCSITHQNYTIWGIRQKNKELKNRELNPVYWALVNSRI